MCGGAPSAPPPPAAAPEAARAPEAPQVQQSQERRRRARGETRSTILTSTRGVTDSANTAAKTLLGQ